MISYTLRSIRERGIRSLLLVLGVLVVSAAFVLLLAAVETTKVTVEEDIAKYWRTTYDILVRPAGSRSPIEDEYGLVQSNHLSNLEGGITLKEWEAIKSIPDVEVAAPIAILGYFNLVFHTPIDVSCQEPGFYRLENILLTRDGLREYKTVGDEFFYCSDLGGPYFHMFDSPSYNWNVLVVTGKHQETHTPWFEEMTFRLPILLAAIDPLEENGLIGLDQALVEGEYLHDIESSGTLPFRLRTGTSDVPVILNHSSYVDFSLETRWFRIQAPFYQVRLDQFQEGMGKDNLAQFPVELINQWHFEGQEAYEIALSTLHKSGSEIGINSLRRMPPGVNYVVTAPVTGQDDLTLEAIAHGSSSSEHGVIGMPLVSFDYQTIFRKTEAAGSFGGDIRFLLQGIYDIEALPQVEDLSRVPLETYYPPHVVLRYDPSGEPTPPITLSPTFNTMGYITSPPLALTTMQSSSWLGFNTEAPISAIRVRIMDIEEFTPEAQSRIEAVAAEIIERTGLDVDITVGSSPKRIFIHLPGENPVPPIGFVEEGWVQMGLSFALAREIKRVNVLLFIVMFIVTGLYILNTSLVSALGRQRVIALQKALGWRDSSVFLHVVLESIFVGLSAGALGLVVAFGLASLLELDIPTGRAILVLPMSVGLCFLGSLLPAFIASRTPPRSILVRGEVSPKSRIRFRNLTIFSLALHQSLRRRARVLLTILTTLTSTALVTIYIGGIVHSHGYLTGTLLGERILVHIGGFQLAIAGVSILVAGIAIADVLFIAVSERRREIGVLKAIGWRSADVVRLFLNEGAVLGSSGGLAGVLLGIITMSAFLDVAWAQMTLLGIVALFIPITAGLINAIVPARIASQIPPAEAVRYE